MAAADPRGAILAAACLSRWVLLGFRDPHGQSFHSRWALLGFRDPSTLDGLGGDSEIPWAGSRRLVTALDVDLGFRELDSVALWQCGAVALWNAFLRMSFFV